MTTVAKADKDLTPFTVTTKNDHRGNRRVSYVRTVGVDVYNLNVIISRQRGRVKVIDTVQIFFDKQTYFFGMIGMIGIMRFTVQIVLNQKQNKTKKLS